MCLLVHPFNLTGLKIAINNGYIQSSESSCPRQDPVSSQRLRHEIIVIIGFRNILSEWQLITSHIYFFEGAIFKKTCHILFLNN